MASRMGDVDVPSGPARLCASGRRPQSERGAFAATIETRKHQDGRTPTVSVAPDGEAGCAANPGSRAGRRVTVSEDRSRRPSPEIPERDAGQGKTTHRLPQERFVLREWKGETVDELFGNRSTASAAGKRSATAAVGGRRHLEEPPCRAVHGVDDGRERGRREPAWRFDPGTTAPAAAGRSRSSKEAGSQEIKRHPADLQHAAGEPMYDDAPPHRSSPAAGEVIAQGGRKPAAALLARRNELPSRPVPRNATTPQEQTPAHARYREASRNAVPPRESGVHLRPSVHRNLPPGSLRASGRGLVELDEQIQRRIEEMTSWLEKQRERAAQDHYAWLETETFLRNR